ncbi:MAG: hypothetical protein FVQ81_13535 [Candidatus Glassbacteria bacterium]|nr:hypothetical protein [Candidatus Glassbacteria bacterium]
MDGPGGSHSRSITVTVTITDSAGVAVPLEQFATDLCGVEQVQPACVRTAQIVGLLALVLVGVVAFYFSVR